MKAVIVSANFYPDISDGLLASCADVLSASGVVWERHIVPGALEIPPALAMLADADANIDLMIALGCVIRGETFHFEIVAHHCAAGILRVQLDTGMPIGNGVLTVEDMPQALARLDKGAAAATAALALAKIKHDR